MVIRKEKMNLQKAPLNKAMLSIAPGVSNMLKHNLAVRNIFTRFQYWPRVLSVVPVVRDAGKSHPVLGVARRVPTATPAPPGNRSPPSPRR